jgi:hypothetical protein
VVIDAQRPHVLTLQEIGSESALGRLQASLKLKMPHREIGMPDDRGIRVAVISRRILHERVGVRPSGWAPAGPDGPPMMNQMGRSALQVTVRASNREVRIVTAHLRSKLLSFPNGFTPADEDQRARYSAYALYGELPRR